MSDDLKKLSSSELVVWQSEVGPGEARELMQKMLGDASAKGVEILVADGEMVFGREHIASAVFHARRAIDEGRNSSDSLAMETLLYASGERQLSSAISKMSVSDETTAVAMVLLSGGDFDGKERGGALSAAASAPRTERLIRYGITREELGTVRPERRGDLVLEKVAAVDLIKR